MIPTIFERLRQAGKSFKANDNIADFLTENELTEIQKNVEIKIRELLEALIIDVNNDHNTKDTPRRIAKMLIREVCAGRYQKMPSVTSFPNVKQLDDILMVGPIDVRSMCSHHFAPILGKAWIAVIPDKQVIGISKFARIADWILCRPQIQEEAAVQLADKLEELTHPKALAVIIKASHTCMTWRGVKESQPKMVTSVMRGLFRTDSDARAEVMGMIE